jgi:site-specific recombinase XerD
MHEKVGLSCTHLCYRADMLDDPQNAANAPGEQGIRPPDACGPTTVRLGASAEAPATTAPHRPPPSDLRDKLDTAHLHGPAVVAVRLEALRGRAAEHIRRSKSEATLRAYQSDAGNFSLWCGQHGLDDLPAEPDTVALYLTACAEAGAAVSTLRRRVVSISQVHKAAGHPSPTATETVRRVLSGIARDAGSRPRQVAALRLGMLTGMLDATPEEDLLAVRDRAILLIGFAGGFRRSELAALDAEDVHFVEEGVDILIRRSKTDQEGHGRTIGIPRGRRQETCPVHALRRWLGIAELTAGPLWPVIAPNGRPGTKRRSPQGRIGTRRLDAQGIARVVQRAAKRAGLDPREFAGHSLRAGFATEAAARGATERAIMRQTGHRSVEMVRRYIREGDRYRDNAAALLGL